METMPNMRWIFGMHDRKTKISLMYYLKEKSKDNIMNVCKKHIATGASVVSDMHSFYVTIGSN